MKIVKCDDHKCSLKKVMQSSKGLISNNSEYLLSFHAPKSTHRTKPSKNQTQIIGHNKTQ